MASNSNYNPSKEEGYKSTKTELISIYRLEFYKNKKNWMLCHDVKKEPTHSTSSTSQSKKLMNETYNIEPEMEQVSPHNQAFLQESDDAPDIQLAPDPQLYVPAAPAPHNLYQHTWVDQSWPEDKSEAVWQDAQQEWCGAEAEGGPEESAGLAALPQPTWLPVNPIPTYEHVDGERDPLEEAGELVQLAEEWLQSHGYPLHQEQYVPYYQQCPLDESAEFIRGAHGVPHSSEIDLIPHDCPMLHCGPLWGTSTRALLAAAHAHAHVLRAILAEHALRGGLHLTTNPSSPIRLEEFPTRDTDPPRAADVLVSGSLRPTPDSGRGRGRLHTHRLIGIGMGRPYRL